MGEADMQNKSRAEMIEYFRKNIMYVRHVGWCLFGFNVKVNNVRFTFDKLAAIAVESNFVEKEKIMKDYREIYLEIFGEDDVYDNERTPEQQDARYKVEQLAFDSARSSFTDNEGLETVQVGRGSDRKNVQMVYGLREIVKKPNGAYEVKQQDKRMFGGASGGYAIFGEVLGYNIIFNNNEDEAFYSLLENKEEYYNSNGSEAKNSPYILSYKDLRLMYLFHIEMSKMLNSEAASREVMYQMAYYVFDDIQNIIETRKMEAMK
jgi:hypothetical protein